MTISPAEATEPQTLEDIFQAEVDVGTIGIPVFSILAWPLVSE